MTSPPLRANLTLPHTRREILPYLIRSLRKDVVIHVCVYACSCTAIHLRECLNFYFINDWNRVLSTIITKYDYLYYKTVYVTYERMQNYCLNTYCTIKDLPLYCIPYHHVSIQRVIRIVQKNKLKLNYPVHV